MKCVCRQSMRFGLKEALLDDALGRRYPAHLKYTYYPELIREKHNNQLSFHVLLKYNKPNSIHFIITF